MKKNNYPGKFIVIEGPDGSGQSTQVKRVKEFFEDKGYQVMTTKEPTVVSEAGKKIKKILEEKIETDPTEFQKLYVQDRKEHLDNLVIPALKEGKIVISDRYFFSTFAFGAAHGSDLDELIKMNNEFLYPDLAFLLEVRPEVCIDRIEKRGDPKTLFEKQEQLAKVLNIYKKLPERFEDFYIVDGEKSIEEVSKQIKKVVLSKLLMEI